MRLTDRTMDIDTILQHYFAPEVSRLGKAKGGALTLEDLESIGYFDDAGSDYPHKPVNYFNKAVDPACNCYMSLKQEYSQEWMNSLFRMEAALRDPQKHMKHACPVHVRTVAAEHLAKSAETPPGDS